ncbi:MAG: hypothetical protein ACYTGR_01665 [Planctomycetota bacterium]|jgi:uncharacterized protein (TIGR03546 family)
MITRKVGKLLRGNATPAQVMSACVLGAMLGFMPGFAAAPGLIVVLSLALIVLNANLFLAGTVAALCQLTLLGAMPATFAVGRVLLDGPAQPLFRALVNAPVLALFGFEYYATTGGLLVGVVVGLGLGAAGVRLLQGFRAAMARLGESERYTAMTNKRSLRILTFVFIGGGKGDYESMMSRKGKIIRPLGVAFAALVLVLLGLTHLFLGDAITTAALRHGLEQANGATVDVEHAELDLREGVLRVQGLAVCDPNALGTDLIRAEEVEADVSTASLLRKRIALDSVVLVDARHGAARSAPGERTGTAPAPNNDPAPPQEGEKTLDDYLADARVWKERLAQVRQWLERVSGDGGGDEPPPAETIEEKIARLGHAGVSADHLIDGSPTLLITRLRAEGVRTTSLPDAEETVDVLGENLSTHPHLVAGSPRLSIVSSKGTISATADLAAIGRGASGVNAISLGCQALPVERLAAGLVSAETPLLSGGTFDASLNGTIALRPTLNLDLPLQATLHDTTITLPGLGSEHVDEFSIPLGIRGLLEDPRIRLDRDALANALVQAGADRLAGELRAEAHDRLGAELSDAVGKDVGEDVGAAVGGLLEGVLGGGKKKKPDG